MQKDLASLFGVNVNTVVGWEIGRKEPQLSYIPAIVAFIGYDPFPDAQSLGERLRTERQRRGLTQHQLARLLDTTQSVVSLLETGGEVSNERVRTEARKFLAPT